MTSRVATPFDSLGRESQESERKTTGSREATAGKEPIACRLITESAYIGGTVKDHKAVLLKAGGIEDHIHLLMKLHPQFAISSTVQLLKANSSRWINEHQKTPSRFQWQRGYGAFSVSQSMVSTVKKYIANQREHHRDQDFEQEYLQLLRLHEIQFDERYVFEQDVIG